MAALARALLISLLLLFSTVDLANGRTTKQEFLGQPVFQPAANVQVPSSKFMWPFNHIASFVSRLWPVKTVTVTVGEKAGVAPKAPVTPVAKASPTPTVQAVPKPVTTKASASPTIKPSVKAPAAPAAKPAPKPAAGKPPQTSAKPAVKASPKPAGTIKASPMPTTVKASPKPAVKAPPAPAGKKTPTPAVPVKASPKPATKASPKPAAKASPAPYKSPSIKGSRPYMDGEAEVEAVGAETAVETMAADTSTAELTRIPGRYVVLFHDKECDVAAATAKLASHVQAAMAAPGTVGAAAATSAVSAPSGPQQMPFRITRAISADQVTAEPAASVQQLTAAMAAQVDSTGAVASGMATASSISRNATRAAAARCRRQRRRHAAQGLVVDLDASAEQATVQAIKGATDVVKFVIQDRVATAAQVFDVQQDTGGCAFAAALSEGIFSRKAATISWPGCATASNQIKFIAERCGSDMNSVRYVAMVAVTRRTGAVARNRGKPCVQWASSTNRQNIRQYFGACGDMSSSLASDLPTKICPASNNLNRCVTSSSRSAGKYSQQITLRSPVKCGGKTATTLNYEGESCGPNGQMVLWTQATTPTGCVLKPSSAPSQIKSTADIFGFCGVPPGLAAAPVAPNACPKSPTDCQGVWSDYGPCSVTCGAGSQTSTYTVLAPARDGGLECEAANGETRTQTCSLDPCDPLPGPKLARTAFLEGQMMPRGMPRIEAAIDEGGVTEVFDMSAVPPEQQILVGIVDSGIDSGHPDLNYVGGQTFVEASKNHPGDQPDAGVDHYGHGTHVAGIVGAKNNGVGTIGVAPGANLYSLKVLDGDGRGTLSNVLTAVQWAATEGVKMGIKVINLSLAAYLDPSADDYEATRAYICDVLKQASDAGVAVVCAAGNYAADLHYYLPANCPGVVTVTALDDQGAAPASYSNFLPADQAGNLKDHFILAAPGSGIMSTISRDKDISGYRELSGTSMASPHVAGLAAKCIMSGACSSSGTGFEKLQALQNAAEAKYRSSPGYGFKGDATSTANGKYYGYLVWDGF